MFQWIYFKGINPILNLPWWLTRWSICLQCGRHRFNPWVGKMPWRRKWQTTPVFLPGKFHGQRSLIGYSPWGHKESDTTEWLHFLFSAESPGKEIKGVRIRKEEAKLFLLQMTWIFKSHSERIYKQKTSRGKESAHNARDTGDAGLIPGWRRSPGGGNSNPFQYSCLKKPDDLQPKGLQKVRHELFSSCQTEQLSKQ